MPYAPQSPFVPSPNGIDPRIVPGVRRDPYPDYPEDWLVLPPSAAPSAAVPAPSSQPNSANPGIPNRAAPRPDPLAAFWPSIPTSSLTEFAWNPPIFPDALGQYPHSPPAPPPFSISSFDGVGGLLGGLTKIQPAPGDFPLGLLGGLANLSRAPADPPLGLLGFVPPPPTAPATPLDPFSGPAWGFSARPPSPLGRLATPAWSPPPAGLGIDGGDPALGRELADSNAATAAYPSGSPSYTQPDSIEYQGGNKGGFLPGSVSETIGDVAKSAGVGVGQGLINSAGFLGDAREFLSGGVQKAADYFAPGSGASAGTFFFKGMPDFVQGAPTSSQLRQQAESVTGPFYEPKTTAGECPDNRRVCTGCASARARPSSAIRFAMLWCRRLPLRRRGSSPKEPRQNPGRVPPLALSPPGPVRGGATCDQARRTWRLQRHWQRGAPHRSKRALAKGRWKRRPFRMHPFPVTSLLASTQELAALSERAKQFHDILINSRSQNEQRRFSARMATRSWLAVNAT